MIVLTLSAVSAGHTPRPRPGGRSAAVRRAVLEAAAATAWERGYAQMSIAEVAQRAGVHVTTIYRRWHSKPELVLDAMLAFAADEVPVPDRGSLRADLTELLREVCAVLRQEPIAHFLRELLALPDQQAVAVRRAFWEGRFARAGAIIDRAIERGEVPAAVEAEDIFEMLVGTAFLRLLVTGRPLDEALVATSVDQVVTVLAGTGGES